MLLTSEQSLLLLQGHVRVAYTKTLLCFRVVFGYAGDLGYVPLAVVAGVGGALSGMLCMMSDSMTSLAEQCVFVVFLATVQGELDHARIPPHTHAFAQAHLYKNTCKR